MNTNSYLGWKDWRDDDFAHCTATQAAYYRAETGIAGAGVRVLEIGFGNGSFIGWARGLGAEVFGVEADATLVARARALLGEDRVFSSLNDPALADLAGTFTQIVAIDVIEHVEQFELPRFFENLRLLLAPAGTAILRFPNGDSPFGRLYQHADPTHVSTLGQEKLRYLARAAGLTVEAIREPRLPAAGFTVARGLRRGLRSIGRYLVERAVGHLYFGGRVIPLDPNYIAILRPDATAVGPAAACAAGSPR